MKFQKELIPTIIILAGLIAVNVFVRGASSEPIPRGFGVRYTSYSAGKQGTKALFLLLEKLGYRPRRLRMPRFSGMRDDGLAIILAADRPPMDETDVERLLEWLRRGNTLLFVPCEHEDKLAEALEIKLAPEASSGAFIAPFALTNLTTGIRELVIEEGGRILTKRVGAVRHFGDRMGGVVISFQEGEGIVVVLSDPNLVTNAGLPKGDNLSLLVNILFSCVTDAKTVYFDEYHHGFERRPTVLHLLKGTYPGWALLQAIFAIILLMFSRGRRFGRPKPMLDELHRSSVEYVISLANIYQAAHVSDMALSNLRERLMRFMRRPPASGVIRELIDECDSRMKEGEISEKELIDLSKRVELARHSGEEK